MVVLIEARRRGLKASVHLAEIPNEKEVDAFLHAFTPDRIGHGTCLTAARGLCECVIVYESCPCHVIQIDTGICPFEIDAELALTI